MAFLAKERTNAKYTVTLKYDDGAAVQKAQVTSFKVTLKNLDDDAQTVINTRDAQEQAVAFSGQIDMHATSGLVTFSMLPADNPIVAGTPNAAIRYERHRLLFDVTANGKRLVHQDELIVENADYIAT